MPVTQLLTTSIDHKSQRAAITAEVLQYLNSDLLCYRAGEPENLAAEQKRVWDPWLAWFGQKFRVVLETTFALTRLDQDKAAHEAVAKAVAALSDSEFTVLQAVVPLTGSIVLALALVDGALAPDEAFVCALCEELFYERIHDLERHGLDPTEERRRQALKRDLQAARDYLTATRS
jgi:chaperone required for assembly of F1-ATPase